MGHASTARLERVAAVSTPEGSPPPFSARAGRDVTGLLHRWSGGDRAALDQLMPLVYDELRRLAAQHMRGERAEHTLPGTGLVHEAYLRLADQSALDLRCRAQFFGLASSMMRRILVDHARARRAAKRDGGTVLSLSTAPGATGAVPARIEAALATDDDGVDLISLDESLQRLEQLDPRQARVVEMRYFVGMSVEQTAQALQLSPTTVKREWATARAWLLRDLGHEVGAAPAGVPIPPLAA